MVIPDSFEYIHIPFEYASGYNNEDTFECIRVSYSGTVFGDTVYPLVFEIAPDLNCWMMYQHFDKKLNCIQLSSLPLRNQYKIQEKFRDWDITPVYGNV